MIILVIYPHKLHENLLDNLPMEHLVELRLDTLLTIDWNLLYQLMQKRPLLLTFRSQQEGGGGGRHSENQRRDILKKIISLNPAYLDLEYQRDLQLINQYSSDLSNTKIILSYHCFSSISNEEIEQKLVEMKKIAAWKYKIAVAQSSTLQAMHMLELMQKHSHFIGISMGEKGYITRILNPIYDQPITYTSMDAQTQQSLGQVSYKQLTQLYRYPTLGAQTKIYGLVGAALSPSPGVKVYNTLFRERAMNAIYLNFEITEEEFHPFVQSAEQLGFSGLSITAPLKSQASCYLRQQGSIHNEPSINTFLFRNQSIFGKSTDGLAALKLLEKRTSLNKKKVLLIGAGGVAEAIAWSLAQEKAELIFVNRTESKAENLAQKYNSRWFSLKSLSSLSSIDYDILIHATSQKQFDLENIVFNNKIILDVAHDGNKLMRLAHQKNCLFLSGKEFWVEQGFCQFQWWHENHDERIKQTMWSIAYD